MSEDKMLNQYQIIDKEHDWISLVVPSLFSSKERSAILQTLLLKREAITNVLIDTDKDSVIIHYDSGMFSEKSLLDLLEIVLANFSTKPKVDEITDQDDESSLYSKEREIYLTIGGMSCCSCALFIEMVLNRNTDIVSAEVDYETGMGVVRSYLSERNILDMISKNGYKAFLIENPDDC